MMRVCVIQYIQESIAMYLMAVALFIFICTSLSSASGQDGKTTQRLVRLYSWTIQSVSVTVPDKGKLRARNGVTVRGWGRPTTPQKRANAVLIRFKESGEELPPPKYTETKLGSKLEKRIEIWYHDWQLPAIIALFDEIGKNEYKIFCQYNESRKSSTNQIERVGDCHACLASNPNC